MSSTVADYYAILGISRNASEAEIKSAFRTKAKRYHPDVSREPDAGNRFRQIYAAYEILADPYKRGVYNMLLDRKAREPVNESSQTYRRYQQTQQRAYEHARKYGRMRYQTFEEKVPDPVSFHLEQVMGLLVTLLILTIGLGMCGFSGYLLFFTGFNGHLVSGYFFGALGIGILQSGLRSLRVLIYIWRDWAGRRDQT
ncbi:MAG: DnaJ domain-containing protein [Bacteroidia bacterium]